MPENQTIDPIDIQRRQLARLDSPRRVAWLRAQLSGYVIDLAARAYFRLPACVDGEEILDPKAEIQSAFSNLAAAHGLTTSECVTAFDAEWRAAIQIAEKAGEKLRIVALSHVKLARSSDGVEVALRNAARRFPDGWPHLTARNIAAIATGFHRATSTRRRA